jgi:hypothetical protein
MGLSDIFADFYSAIGFTEAYAEAPEQKEDESSNEAGEEAQSEDKEEGEDKEGGDEDKEDEEEPEEEEEEEDEPVDPKPKLEDGMSIACLLLSWAVSRMALIPIAFLDGSIVPCLELQLTILPFRMCQIGPMRALQAPLRRLC